MRNPFRLVQLPRNVGIADIACPGFTPGWQPGRLMPTPGTGNQVWETIQLAAFTPIGHGVRILKDIVPFNGAPMWTPPGTIVAGIPTIAGQIVMQPLLNPYVLQPPGAPPSVPTFITPGMLA